MPRNDIQASKDQVRADRGADASLRKPPAATSLASSEETRVSGKGRILLFKAPVQSEDPQGPDSPSPLAGASPAAYKLEEKRGLVLYQFVETNGDTRVVARRHGVEERDVKSVVARMIRPVLTQILREAA